MYTMSSCIAEHYHLNEKNHNVGVPLEHIIPDLKDKKRFQNLGMPAGLIIIQTTKEEPNEGIHSVLENDIPYNTHDMLLEHISPNDKKQKKQTKKTSSKSPKRTTKKKDSKK